VIKDKNEKKTALRMEEKRKQRQWMAKGGNRTTIKQKG
jgi:hypothetical protein